MIMIIIGFLLPFCAFSLETIKSVESHSNDFQLKNGAAVLDAFEMLPKDCKKNGKTFKLGEEFSIGNLRYKCQKYGVYSIEGCKMKDDKPMKLGETIVVDNIKYQCLSVGSSVFFRETTCGIMGQPSCDDISPPSRFVEAQKEQKKVSENEKGATNVGGVQLPKGWRIVDGGTNKMPGTNASIVTQILMFNPLEHRTKRQSGTTGIGRVIGVEEVKGESGHPDMPPAMLMGLSSKNDQKSHNSKTIGTQNVGAKLNMIKTGDKNDKGLIDLNQRNDQKINKMKMKKGSIIGSRSDVEWKGKQISVNGKTIGAGAGNFVFGNRPTSG